MAKTQAKNPMAGKILKGVKEHKHDATVMDTGGDLPPGIDGGVAQLTDCYIGYYEKEGYVHKGQPYFMAAGIVQTPETHNGVKVAGRRTQIGPEPICDTPEKTGPKARKTQQEHVWWMLNELKKFDPGAVAELPDECTVEDIDALCKSFADAKPFFSFRTWASKPTKQYPDPRTNHVWNGIVSFDQDDADAVEDEGGTVEDEVDDDTPEPEEPEDVVDETEGEPEEETEPEDDSEPEEETEEEDQEPDEDYVNALMEKVAEQDGDALNEMAGYADKFSGEFAATLNAYAVKVSGKKKKEVDNLPNWESVVALVTDSWEAANAAVEEEEEEEEGPYEPSVGDIVTYKPKGASKPNKYEVTKAIKKDKTAKLKNVESGKSLANMIPWDKLTKVD